MTSFKDIVKFEEEKTNEKQANIVYNCLNIIKDWSESSNRKLLFSFVGTVKNLKIKLKI